MTDIPHLILEMKQGRLPAWSPNLIMRIGDALDDKLDQLDLLLEADTEERLANILIAFGALDPEDRVTGPLDLIEILLPPREPPSPSGTPTIDGPKFLETKS